MYFVSEAVGIVNYLPLTVGALNDVNSSIHITPNSILIVKYTVIVPLAGILIR